MDNLRKHCREYVIGLLNEAFNHSFTYEYKIRITERNSFELIGPEKKAYIWILMETGNRSKCVFVFECDPGSYSKHIVALWDAVLIRMPSVALIQLGCNMRFRTKINCIIDTVIASVVFPVTVVNAAESDTVLSAIAYSKEKYS